MPRKAKESYFDSREKKVIRERQSYSRCCMRHVCPHPLPPGYANFSSKAHFTLMAGSMSDFRGARMRTLIQCCRGAGAAESDSRKEGCSVRGGGRAADSVHHL